MMESGTGRDLTAWEEIGGRAIAPSTPRSLQCRISDITDTDPCSPAEIIGELTPLLALVAPTGMDRDARRVWFNAAVRALEGIPILLLKRGVEAAIAKADHPSKIVPTILGSVKEDWEWRRNYRAPKPVQAWEPSSRVPEGERREVAAMFDELLGRLGRDSDRSPEGGDGEAGSVADESAGPQDIAKDQAA